MLGSSILEVAIGIAFVFLLVSTICTAVREGIEAWFRSRAAYLEYGIRELLHDRSGSGLAASLYRHPMIHGLYLGSYEPSPEIATSGIAPPVLANGRGLPSYIPARSFAIALMDIAARGPRTDLVSSDPASLPLSVAAIRANVLNLQNPDVQRVLLYALDASRGDLDAARAHIEAWFDSAMDRVSGWYKRSTQWIVLVIALSLTILLNVDTIRIAQFLYRDDAARAVIVSRAEAAASNPDGGREAASRELAALNLPIGWESQRQEPVVWLTRILGWLLTALAATLGAPFWFDVLNKFMVIRSTVKPHEKSPEESSEDRQRPAERPTGLPATVAAPAPAASPTARAGNGADGAHPRPAHTSTLRDADSGVDACGGIDDHTPDEQLPVATGGVA